MEIALLLFILFLYFLPTVIAISRDHKNKVAIFILNIAGGWTGFLWLGALIWAVMN